MDGRRDYDVVLYGATGFTGGLVAEYLACVAGKQQLRWALAGRNREKLEAVRARLPLAVERAPEIALADAADRAALGRMVERARVVITTVGPYQKYGEPLVEVCAERGSDYVDLTGEPEFVDAIARFHPLAERNRVKIVNACGFDSVPHDLGAFFTVQALAARMSEAERASAAITVEGIVRARGGFSGGTLHSALEIMANLPARLRKRRDQSDQAAADQAAADQAAAPAQAKRMAAQLPSRIAHRDELGLWTVPLPTIDPEVVVRSARLLPEYGPDFRYGHYLGVKHLGQVASLVAGAGTVFALAQLPPARGLLRKLKDPGEGPSESERAKGYFRVLFLAQAAGHALRCEVRGGDPGYGETAKMLGESALCLAFDRDRLPEHFGVVPPAAAMGNPLIDRLRAAGITFREL